MSVTTTNIRVSLVLAVLAALLHGTDPAPVRAQQPGPTATVVVRVGDATGAPMAGAVVEALVGVRPVARGETSPDGLVRLTVAAGPVGLQARSLGWFSGDTTTLTLAPGETRRVDIVLRPDPVRAEGVTATALSSARPSVDAHPSFGSAVERGEVERRPALSLADVSATEPGVDAAETGLQGRTLATRGLSNIFTGAVLFLVDYRDAALPSLRADFTHFVPTATHDVERMEVVLGPTTAVYGPNAANGVVHVLTRSPLEVPSTFLSLGGGSRSLFQGRFRTNAHLGERVGVKVSGAWFQAEEYPFDDPTEAAIRAEITSDPDGYAQELLDRGVPESEIPLRMGRTGIRDLGIERWSLAGRVDAVVGSGDTLVVQGGTADNSGIELTPLGAAQAGGWRYGYAQTRFHSGPLFAQLFVNTSGAGDTWLLQDGGPLVDESRVLGAQVRHGFPLSDGRHEITYGADWLLTTPRTGGTIHGQFEDGDEIEEYGGYLQGRFGLDDRLDLIATGRVDESNVVRDPVFSPRAALVFQPSQGRSFRVSVARGFSTPTPTNTFLDLSGGRAQDPLGSLGYLTRAQGTGRDGIHFQRPDGSYLMRSPLTSAADGGPAALVPATARDLWSRGVDLLALQGAVDAQTAAFLRSLDPGDAVLVHALNPVTGSVTPLADAGIPDVEPLKETTTTTVEVGYQGLVGERLLIQAGLWRTWRRNFVSPPMLATPLLLLDEESLAGFLTSAGVPAQQAGALAAALGPVPLGVISSPDIQSRGAELVASYVNHGEMAYWGADVGFRAELNRRWSLDGSVSWVSEDHFETDGRRVTLNAPELKAALGVGLTNLPLPLDAEARVRYHSSFPVSSGDYAGTRCLGDDGPLVEDCVDDTALVDLSVGYRLPWEGAALRLKARNLFDTPYRSFVGSPTTGRVLTAQMDWTIH